MSFDQTLKTSITHFYQHFLERSPDPGGLRTWTEHLSHHGPLSTIEGILNSQEYHNKYPDAQSFVTSLYRKLLDREPDPNGLNDWINVYNTRGRKEVIKGFLGSTEFKRKVDTSQDIVGIPSGQLTIDALHGIVGTSAALPTLWRITKFLFRILRPGTAHAPTLEDERRRRERERNIPPRYDDPYDRRHWGDYPRPNERGEFPDIDDHDIVAV